jgi:predicted DNA-binding protein
MLHKKEAINVLLSTEVNDGLQTLASNLGVSKSKVVRMVCVYYLQRQNLLQEDSTNILQHL